MGHTAIIKPNQNQVNNFREETKALIPITCKFMHRIQKRIKLFHLCNSRLFKLYVKNV